MKDETLRGFLDLNNSMETQRKQTTSYEGCSQERRLEAGRNAHQAVNKAKEYINDVLQDIKFSSRSYILGHDLQQ
ncbi:MAG: hypothetical protein CI947_775 [Halanaerobium sp.]|nr:MAG: hypothetical protein CI947_775 [Halanaerobium sp.]